MVLCLAGVSFVLITGQLFQVMRILIASSCSLSDVGQVIAFAMPKLTLYSAPMAVMLGVMLAFGRLNGDNELVALRAAGTGFFSFLPPVLCILMVMTTLAFANSIFIMPFTNDALDIKLRSLGRTSIPVLLKEGVFISSVPKLVFFFKTVDHSELTMKGVFIQDQRQPQEKVTIAAESAELIIPPDTKTITFRINNGIISRTAESLNDAQVVSFKNYDFTLLMDELLGRVTKEVKRRKDMTLAELNQQIVNAKDAWNRQFYGVEFHERLAFPAACLLLGLLGPPLGALFRQNRITGATIGVGIFLSHYIIHSAGTSLCENGMLSPFVAVWLPNMLGFALAVHLWTKMHTEKPFTLIMKLEPLIERILTKMGVRNRRTA